MYPTVNLIFIEKLHSKRVKVGIIVELLPQLCVAGLSERRAIQFCAPQHLLPGKTCKQQNWRLLENQSSIAPLSRTSRWRTKKYQEKSHRFCSAVPRVSTDGRRPLWRRQRRRRTWTRPTRAFPSSSDRRWCRERRPRTTANSRSTSASQRTTTKTVLHLLVLLLWGWCPPLPPLTSPSRPPAVPRQLLRSHPSRCRRHPPKKGTAVSRGGQGLSTGSSTPRSNDGGRSK